MAITSTKCGVWVLDDTYKKVASGCWAYSITSSDPGELWSWGYNTFGQLGDSTTIHRSSPVQIPGTSWNDVAGGFYHSLARKTDGTLWSWGLNNRGQLGDNTVTHRSSPVQVPGTSWNDVAAGCSHSLARKSV